MMVKKAAESVAFLMDRVRSGQDFAVTASNASKRGRFVCPIRCSSSVLVFLVGFIDQISRVTRSQVSGSR